MVKFIKYLIFMKRCLKLRSTNDNSYIHVHSNLLLQELGLNNHKKKDDIIEKMDTLMTQVSIFYYRKGYKDCEESLENPFK